MEVQTSSAGTETQTVDNVTLRMDQRLNEKLASLNWAAPASGAINQHGTFLQVCLHKIKK